MMCVDDNMIVQLYWDRNELAIPATAAKYGAYCTAIARNILASAQDAEECVNDTYLHAWNAIPPARPDILSAFLGRITRNLAFNRHKQNTADKRGGGELTAVLDELCEIASRGDDTQQALDQKELTAAIDAFLGTLSPEKRSIFLCRYWYNDSISAIAKRFHRGEGAVSMTLSRLRRKLKTYLTERGYDL